MIIVRINHNISALNTYRQLSVNNAMAAKSLEKLSSGLRINRAADDAAGLAISEKMRGQIRGLNQAVRNAQDAISLLQTAEGALTETHSILQRMRELAVQAANETSTDSDRAEIQKEINQLISELDRIATSTEFNTKKLLNGSAGAVVSAQNGMNTSSTESILVNGATVATSSTVSQSNLEAAVQVTAGAETQPGVYTVEVTRNATAAKIAAQATVDWTRLGSETDTTLTINGYTVALATTDTIDNVITKINNLTAQTGVRASKDTNNYLVLTTTDVGSKATINVSGTNALLKALGLVASADNSTTVLSDAGEDAQGKINNQTAVGIGNTLTLNKPGDPANGLTVKLISVDLDPDGNGTFGTLRFDASVDVTGRVTLQIGANDSAEQRLDLDIGDMRAKALGVDNIDVTDAAKARSAITTVNSAIQTVSSERAKLGAYQNRLEHTINNLSVAAENLTAAESRIRDVDMAQEMMEFTKLSILQQAATAMLAQANMQPQMVLQLLGR